MPMDKFCRLCGFKSEHLIVNDELVNRVFECFHFTNNTDTQFHKRFCVLCEDKLKLTNEFYQCIIDTELRFTSMDEEKEDEQFIESDPDMMNQVRDKIYKLPNLKITKIRSAEQKEVEQLRKIEVSELIDRLSNKNITISKISNKLQSESEYCNLEVLEDVSIMDDTEEYVDLTDVPEMLNIDSNLNSSQDMETNQTSEKAISTLKPSIKSKKTIRSKNVTVVKMETPAAYVCMTCKDQFTTFELLKHHMASNQKCKTFHLTCEVCKKVCGNKKSLYQHTLTHRAKYTFTCDECGKSYTNRFNLENHKSSYHGEQVEEFGSIYKCKVCEKQFTNRKNLYEHISMHIKVPSVHLCDTCGKCFKSADTLSSHQRIHLDIRPFPCEQCERRFRSRFQLAQHLHVHTGIKEYTCNECGKAFAKRGSLVSHARVHTGEAPFECEICTKRFTSLNRLKAHTKLHYLITAEGVEQQNSINTFVVSENDKN